MPIRFFLSVGVAALFLPSLLFAASVRDDIEFRADYYQRDLQTNSVRGKGNAWIKRGDKELWADEVEIDFNTNKAIANGNVRVREGDLQMWANHIDYQLKGDEAMLESATIVSGKLVMTGEVIHKLSAKRFEIQDGTYTNCNTELLKDRGLSECSYDWKIYGSRFSITSGEYAHVNDAVVSVQSVPIFYAPYFIFPLKSGRQSGFILPRFTHVGNLGSGVTVPYFWAIGPWHDMTLTPTYYSIAGYHVGVNYRYIYSGARRGSFNFFVTQRKFGPLPNPGVVTNPGPKFLGVVGEWAIDIRNMYGLAGRSHTLQTIRLVSNPYYTFDYGADLSVPAEIASLRSQISYTAPGDEWLLTARATHQQSLIISKDTGSDGGDVTQAPVVGLSRTNSPLLGNHVSFEVDSQFANYYRFDSVDQRAENPKDEGDNFDTNRDFDENDFLRTGRRLHVEPRLVANVPMPPGFRFVPLVKAGALFYQFDIPKREIAHRQYIEAELPVDIYLSKRFTTPVETFEQITHVFQPRFIYATSPYQNEESTHPFFRKGSPRFDIIDQVTPFEYMRFELRNRFLRKTGTGVERFFLLQVSEQYNLRTSNIDPRYRTRLGPVEILAEAKIWRFEATLQALYQLEFTDGTRESDLSTGITYLGEGGDLVRMNGRFVRRADNSQSQQSIYMSAYKRLPLFFNIGGDMEYSLKEGRLLGYMVGFYFEEKPRSCWSLGLETGRNSYSQPFTRMNFRLDFGNPNDLKPF